MTSGRAYHHGNLREALVDAGLDILRSGGPEALTTRACAAAAGVAPSAVFRHFKSRKSLATAIAARGFEMLGERVEAAAADGKRRFRAIGEAYLDFALLEPEVFRLMFRGELIDWDDPDFRAVARSLMADTATQAEGEGDRSLIAWAIVHGLATLAIDSQLELSLPKDPEARRQRLYGLLDLTEPVFRA